MREVERVGGGRGRVRESKGWERVGREIGMMMISTCQIIQTFELLKMCKLQIIQLHIKIIIL